MGVSQAPRITFVYRYSADLGATRAFYEGLLGLRVAEDNEGFVGFSAGVSLVFLLMSSPSGGRSAPSSAILETGELSSPSGSVIASPPDFSSFPGWDGGTAQRALCSIECSKAELEAVAARLREAGVKCTEAELRDGAQELRAIDPDGNTVELYAIADAT
jgi:catechol 2,3-dioxygenase-like lactoylglutathione lyase family enzyme